MHESLDTGLPESEDQAVDKTQLLQSGKYFGRIFLDYLFAHPGFAGPQGKEALAHELLTLGQVAGEDRDALPVKKLIELRWGRQKIPYWLNRALVVLALEQGFIPTHIADSVGIVASLIKELHEPDRRQLRPERSFDFQQLLTYLQTNYQVALPPAHHPWVIQYLQDRGYQVRGTE